MAERSALLTSKTTSGLDILYPITKVENIDDLEEATCDQNGLMSSTDKAKLDRMPCLRVDKDGVYYEI